MRSAWKNLLDSCESLFLPWGQSVTQIFWKDVSSNNTWVSFSLDCVILVDILFPQKVIAFLLQFAISVAIWEWSHEWLRRHRWIGNTRGADKRGKEDKQTSSRAASCPICPPPSLFWTIGSPCWRRSTQIDRQTNKQKNREQYKQRNRKAVVLLLFLSGHLLCSGQLHPLAANTYFAVCSA